jgi:hypothetical protein
MGAASELMPAVALPSARETAISELQAMAEHNANGSLPLQNGFARPLDPIAVRLGPGELANRRPASFAKGVLSFAPDSESLVWSALIKVSEAGAFRIHLRDVELPSGAVLFVYSDPEHALGPFDVGLRDPLGGIWLPAVEGELAYVEVQVPALELSTGGEVRFTIDKVAELFFDNAGSSPVGVASEHSPTPSAKRAIIPMTAPTCLVDSSCVTSSTLSAIASYRTSVAQLQFMSGASSYLCSGGLVNDKDPTSFIPYLLTAHHCFSTQTEASSVTAYFDYKSAFCNGADPCCRSNFPSVSGATLLDSRAVSDFTLIRLNSSPSGSRYFLGWTAASLSNGQIMHRLSHPAPDGVPLAQRYSQSSYEASGGITCSDTPRPGFLYSAETSGTMTGGSSGAPVIIDVSGGQIVGQLHGACSFTIWDWCTYSSYNTVDGAFATTYPYVSQWLDPTVTVTSASTSPVSVAAGNTFTITYDVTASTGTNVLLGASMRPSGTSSWTISDSSHDRFLTLANGSSSVTRQFTVLAGTSPGNYDLLVAVWRDSNANGIIDSGDVTLNSAMLLGGETVTASSQTLTVTKLGTGSGSVTSSPAGINCGSTCQFAFTANSQVTLTESAASGSVFGGWTNACAGAGMSSQCTVTMSQALTATANFGGSAPGAFSKISPANGATGQSTGPVLSWSASSNSASYEYCIDATNDNAAAGGRVQGRT